MDPTLVQILSALFQLQAEIDRLKAENEMLKRALEAPEHVSPLRVAEERK